VVNEISKLLSDPAFPTWGKRLVSELLRYDPVDVSNVLDVLAKVFGYRADDEINRREREY
jgi:hypothetical protein